MMKRKTIAALFSIIAITACDGSSSNNPQTVYFPGTTVSAMTASGHATYANGTPIANQSIQVRLTFGGNQLFANSTQCHRMNEKTLGNRLVTVSTDANGAFSFTAATHEISSIIEDQCHPTELKSSQIQTVRIDAWYPTNAAICKNYCGASSFDQCEEQCQDGARILSASHPLSSNEVTAFLAKTQRGALNFSQDLVFDTLGTKDLPQGGVDLQVDPEEAATSVKVANEDFAPDSCALVEACVGAPGTRKIMRFGGGIMNMGDQDLVLGNPESNPLFVFSACHNHYHLRDIMLYELFNSAGQQVSAQNVPVVGRKQGFCMEDMVEVFKNPSKSPANYDCTNQGISAGYEDLYDNSLDCQWLDVTGVPAGEYTLKITVNPYGLFPESNTRNNSVSVPVTIPN